MNTVTLPRLLAAAGIGILHYWALVAAWGVLGAANPLNEMLLDTLVRHEKHLVAYRVLISIHDLVIHLLIAVPFAAVFRFIPALRNWTYVMLAAVATLVAVYASTELDALPLLLTSGVFWLGVVTIAGSLPAAFTLWNRLYRSPGASPVVPYAA